MAQRSSRDSRGNRDDRPRRNDGPPNRNAPAQGAQRPQGARGFAGPPRPTKLAVHDDPNAYRSPGFQDVDARHVIDYAGLPRDDDEVVEASAASAPATGAPAEVVPPSDDAMPSSNAARPARGLALPRGMYGRRPDRGGMDPNAYRSPAFHDSDPTRGRGPRRDAPRGGRPRDERPRHEAPCSACGAPAVVPFVPTEERPALCKSCYLAKKNATSATG